MNQHETQAEIGRVRESGALGRAGVLSRLFDFLADHAFDERPPKEAEIALKVFGRAADDGGQDAAVRVYVHRLRRKLEDHYLRNPSADGVRIALPKGEYRLVGEEVETPQAASPPRRRRVGLGWIAAGLVAAFAALNLTAWAFVAGGSDREAAQIRRTALWSPIARSRFPVLIVVGDYYLVGERGEDLEVKRLVREFSVNSRDELYEFLMVHPEMTDQYIDLGLSYLPVSTGAAVQRISRLVPPDRNVRVIPASEFTRAMFKTSDVIYVGHLSALGPLRDTVFSASRLTFGDTYDEIVDKVTRQTYESQAAASAVLGGGVYSDYGYLASLEGPSGNRIIVVAGTRDTSALGLSEIATQLAALRTLGARTGKAASFEALYRVRGSGNVNFETDLVLASPVDARKIWRGGVLAPPRFPTG